MFTASEFRDVLFDAWFLLVTLARSCRPPRPSVVLKELARPSTDRRLKALDQLRLNPGLYCRNSTFLSKVVTPLSRFLCFNQEQLVVSASAAVLCSFLDCGSVRRKLKVRDANMVCVGLVEGLKNESLAVRLELKRVALRLLRLYPAKMVNNLKTLSSTSNHLQKTSLAHLLIVYLLEAGCTDQEIVADVVEITVRLMISGSMMVRRAAMELVYVLYCSGCRNLFDLVLLHGASSAQCQAARHRVERGGALPEVVDQVAVAYYPILDGIDGVWVLHGRRGESVNRIR